MGGQRARTDVEWSVLLGAAEVLMDRIPALTDQLIGDLVKHSPLFDLAVPRDEHWQQVSEAMHYGIEAFAARRSEPRKDLVYAEELGRRRAGQGLPLDLLLYAYRRAGRLTWEALLDIVTERDPDALPVLARTAGAMWAGIEQQAAATAEAYRTAEREMRQRSDERVQALLDALLEGEAGVELAARAAAGLDLPEQGRYAVVVLPADRRDALHRIEAVGGMRLFWRMRTERELAVVALGPCSLDDLTAELTDRCPGPGGISPVVDGLTELGRARRLAETALRTCGPEDRALVRLTDRLPTALVVRQPELAAELIASVLGPLLELDPADRAVLLDTLDAWLASEGSAGRAATRLYCHRNTVFNRLRRLEQLTSRSLSRPHDLTALTLARDAYRLSTTPPPTLFPRQTEEQDHKIRP
ncbi:PucR family transcriptional regulator [Streptomyces venezuelae]|uniref:PucR family transcriptional regulator n=1 Tax=Streptomyces venezuelae TaxID=54571 RepID=A0A5P2CWX5_STRVZ|nr:helix-turn-helix domain-containing protein [Streptomyces venezuelae]QES47406.1 PucR family transcriptional regulator [Streptomyces venezuelae]